MQCWELEVFDGHLAPVLVTRPTVGCRGRIPAAACALSGRLTRDTPARLAGKGCAVFIHPLGSRAVIPASLTELIKS